MFKKVIIGLFIASNLIAGKLTDIKVDKINWNVYKTISGSYHFAPSTSSPFGVIISSNGSITAYGLIRTTAGFVCPDGTVITSTTSFVTGETDPVFTSSAPLTYMHINERGDFAVWNATFSVLSKSSAVLTYLLKIEKAADSELFDGEDSSAFSLLSASETATGQKNFTNTVFISSSIESNQKMVIKNNVELLSGSTYYSEILITEVRPNVNKESIDWVEIYNVSTNAINIQNWAITDMDVAAEAFADSAVTLLPNSYAIIHFPSDTGYTGGDETDASAGDINRNGVIDLYVTYDLTSNEDDIDSGPYYNYEILLSSSTSQNSSAKDAVCVSDNDSFEDFSDITVLNDTISPKQWDTGGTADATDYVWDIDDIATAGTFQRKWNSNGYIDSTANHKNDWEAVEESSNVTKGYANWDKENGIYFFRNGKVFLEISGNKIISRREIDMDNHTIVNHSTNPINNSDVVTKGYSDYKDELIGDATSYMGGQISSLQGQITSNDSDIESLSASTSTNAENIASNYSALQATGAALSAEIAETDTNFTIVNSSLTDIHDNYAKKDSTTNWTGDNTFNGIKINAGNYVTKIKGGAQTGNIVYTLPVSTDGVAGYHLQYLPSGALSWQPPELVGVQNYYYSTQTINSDYVMYSSHSAVAEGSISKTITADVILGTWTTLSGYPTGDAIPAGTWDIHVHAVQTAGTKDCRLYGKIYLKASGGSLTYLGETGKTKVLSDTEQAYDIMLQTGVINLTAGDAILMVGNAEPSGSGSDPQITIYFGSTKGSLLALPAPTIDVNNYIPYAGATKDVNLGAYNITAADIHNNYQLDLDTPNWKAADTDLLDGRNYDAFVSTTGDTMNGSLFIEKEGEVDFEIKSISPGGGGHRKFNFYIFSEEETDDFNGGFGIEEKGLTIKFAGADFWTKDGSIFLGNGKTVDGRDISEDGALLDKINQSTHTMQLEMDTKLSTGVAQIVAGDNITIDPPDGKGIVTINASTGAIGGGSSIISKNFFLPTTPFVTNYADKTSFGNFAVTISSIIVMCDDCPIGSGERRGVFYLQLILFM